MTDTAEEVTLVGGDRWQFRTGGVVHENGVDNTLIIWFDGPGSTQTPAEQDGRIQVDGTQEHKRIGVVLFSPSQFIMTMLNYLDAHPEIEP